MHDVLFIFEREHRARSKLGGALAKILIASPRVLNFSVERKTRPAANFLQHCAREPHCRFWSPAGPPLHARGKMDFESGTAL
jgi:hypothetical protein